MRLTILILFAISLSLLGGETKEIGYWLLEKRGEGGNQVAYFQDKLYTGKTFGYWHKSSQKQSETIYKDGKKVHETWWFKNGQKSQEQNFKEGIWQGPVKGWYSNGQIKKVLNYKSGFLMSVEVWKPNGEKCPNTTLKDGNGVLVIYNDDGTVNSRTTYMDGRKAKD